MYGFSGYASNAYGSQRQTTTLLTVIVTFGARVFQSAYGVATTLMRFNSARTFSDPESTAQTFPLHP